MIQNFRDVHGGLVSFRATDPRRRARRMRLAAIMVTVAVALSGGVLQQFHYQAKLNAQLGEAQAVPTGSFAYFPR